VLVYEALAKDLFDIIAKLISHLDCKDRLVASLLLLLRASPGEVISSATTDLRVVEVEGKRGEKGKEEETTAIVAVIE
jgi:hypothetical protein